MRALSSLIGNFISNRHSFISTVTHNKAKYIITSERVQSNRFLIIWLRDVRLQITRAYLKKVSSTNKLYFTSTTN